MKISKNTKAQKAIKEYLAELGRKGAKARQANSTPDQRSKWAKLGGRPKKNKYLTD